MITVLYKSNRINSFALIAVDRFVLFASRAHAPILFHLNRVPLGLEDVSTYLALFAELIRRGWSDDNLVKLAGKNLIRVFTRVEQVRDGFESLSSRFQTMLYSNNLCR